MWPSFPVANQIADWANIFFIGSLAVGLISTGLIVWMANVKEGYWEKARLDAEERIASLVAQGDQAKAELGTAQADIAKASAKIAGANEAAAHANERAATLEKEAAEARAQQEILRQRLAWRRIDPRKYVQLVADLKPLATIIGVSTFSDPESSAYADDIAGALSDAGFEVKRNYFMSVPRYDMAISEGPSRLSENLASIFGVAGVLLTRRPIDWSTPNAPSTQPLGVLEWPSNLPALFVGLKPRPSL